MQEPHLAPLVPPVLMALVLLPRGNLQTLGSGPCHTPGPCTLCTIPRHALVDKLSYLVSNSASQGTSFLVARESIGLPSLDLVSESRAISSRPPKLQLKLLAFVATTRSINAVLMMLQTIRDVAHLLVSCSICELCTSIFDPSPTGFRLVAL